MGTRKLERRFRANRMSPRWRCIGLLAAIEGWRRHADQAVAAKPAMPAQRLRRRLSRGFGVTPGRYFERDVRCCAAIVLAAAPSATNPVVVRDRMLVCAGLLSACRPRWCRARVPTAATRSPAIASRACGSRGPTCANPALWMPPGMPADADHGRRSSSSTRPPTSTATRWNAPLDDPRIAATAPRLFVRSQASAFNGSAQIWAPRYRQATFGAFLTSEADARTRARLRLSRRARRLRRVPRAKRRPTGRSSSPGTARARSI